MQAPNTLNSGLPLTARTGVRHSIVRLGPAIRIYRNRDDSISFGTEERDYFGSLPSEIIRAVPESVINTIASIVCHAHRMGRKEAYNPGAF